jgi:hypothetical protein
LFNNYFPRPKLFQLHDRPISVAQGWYIAIFRDQAMKYLLSVVTLLFFQHFLFAQKKGDHMLGINMDLIKSDYPGFFTKAQVSFEGNYFFSPKFTGTVGIEAWTRGRSSGVIGTRWYPTKEAYIRVRGLIGANLVSIGGGWLKPMTEDLQFEAMTDFYTNGYFSIRAGFAYFIGRKM